LSDRKKHGTVWTIEEGASSSTGGSRHQLLDRYEITGVRTMPVIARIRAGRAASIAQASR
jgi:hypothetical protein